MMNSLLRTVILLILALHASAALTKAQRQAGDQLALITVSGQAEVKVAPDEVVFTLSVVKLDKDLMAAKEQNDQSVRRIMELARRYNIAPQDVQTDYISVEPKYHEERSPVGSINDRVEIKQIFDGYQVSKTVAIRLRDISRFESFLTDILKAGIDRLSDMEFRTSEMRKYRDRARSLAIRAAREKAVAITKEIGQTVGPAYSIREDSYVAGSPSANTSIYANNVSTEDSGGSRDMDEESSTIAPGMITVSARVTVSFRLQ
ncbi:MAG: SIMPL domain-containing protein [Pyrinomonadaceae bacterium]|nr:SIMPL domain-containing protein [Pyrinomonadaceae bacterium]